MPVPMPFSQPMPGEKADTSRIRSTRPMYSTDITTFTT